MQALDHVFGLLNLVAQDAQTDDEALAQAIALIGDMATNLSKPNPGPVMEKLRVVREIILHLIGKGMASSNEDTQEKANWTREELQKLGFR
jgi:hypothetical protein